MSFSFYIHDEVFIRTPSLSLSHSFCVCVSTRKAIDRLSACALALRQRQAPPGITDLRYPLNIEAIEPRSPYQSWDEATGECYESSQVFACVMYIQLHIIYR